MKTNNSENEQLNKEILKRNQLDNDESKKAKTETGQL